MPEVSTYPQRVSAPSLPPKRYLTGVQGLRTVAALLVAVYHIWFHRVSGGVDVFFVVAGFFAAGSLTRLYARVRRPNEAGAPYANYLLRTGRRILPSAVVVIVATVVMSWFWMPKAYWETNIQHGYASLFNFENWKLIEESRDYLAQDLAASPFQRFWALSVNVQVYLVFATLGLLIALAVSLFARLGPKAFRSGFAWVAGVVFAAYFVFSSVYTNADQPAAYFSTFTRLWEFMVGSAAFLMLRGDLGRQKLFRALGWIGLASLLLLGAFLDLSAMLPGYLSLIPVLAAIGMILASWERVEPAALTWRPVLWFADASFAFYLWHWPLLVFYRYNFGVEVGLLGGLGIILVSAVLAVITTKLIEDPIRKAKTLTASPLLAALTLVGLLGFGAAFLLGWGALKDMRSSSRVEARPIVAGAQSSAFGDLPTRALDISDLIPSVAEARGDNSKAYSAGCHVSGDEPAVTGCVWGELDGQYTIALVGGSHSLHWLDSIANASETLDAKVLSYTKSNCLFGDVEQIGVDLRPSCTAWNEELLELLLETKPDLVVTIGTRRVDGVEQVPAGYTSRFQQLTDAGISVLAMRDNPMFEFDPLVCVEENKWPWTECSTDRTAVFVSDEELDFPQMDGLYFLDMTDVMCDSDVCPVVDGQSIMYRDDNHFTLTWLLANDEILISTITEILGGG